jgi:DNA-binding MarR family transcriptional regulator
MKRQEIIQALLQNMEAIGKAMMSRKIEKPMSSMPTHAQLGILLVVLYQGPQSIKNLADKFRMTSSAATQLVNGLVQDRLLTRVEDKKDRRQIHVEMTAKGKRTLAIAKKQREKNMLEIFQPLTDTELMQLEKIQRKITERLQILWTKNQTK